MQTEQAAPSEFFQSLRSKRQGPTLTDARAWREMDRIERKAFLRLAGYSTAALQNRGDLSSLAAKSWEALPPDARTRIKATARRLMGVCSRFGKE